MVAAHIERGIGVTVAGIRVPRAEATEFGVSTTGADGHAIKEFLEKPADPPGLPDARTSPSPRWATTSSPATSWSRRCATTPPTRPRGTTWAATSSRCSLPRARRGSTTSTTTTYRVPSTATDLLAGRRVAGFVPRGAHGPGLDPAGVQPVQPRWPIFTSHPQLPGAKFTDDATVGESIVCQGSIVTGGDVDHSVLGSNVIVSAGADIQRCVIMDNCKIGKDVVLRTSSWTRTSWSRTGSRSASTRTTTGSVDSACRGRRDRARQGPADRGAEGSRCRRGCRGVTTEAQALALDATDAGHRDLFHVPPAEGGRYPDVAYFAGNSLGLQPRAVPRRPARRSGRLGAARRRGASGGRPALAAVPRVADRARVPTGRRAPERDRGDELAHGQPAPADGVVLPAGGPAAPGSSSRTAAFPSDSYAVRSQARLPRPRPRRHRRPAPPAPRRGQSCAPRT